MELLSELELTDELLNSLDSLTHRQKQCFLLHHLGHYKYKEIALKLNISIKAIGTHISRAKKKLKETNDI
jgi:RNA polymerase sigma factor (sigma-70 family)